MGLTSRLRRWLFALCQSRSAQCSPTLRVTGTCRSELAREQAPLKHQR
ncbi:hypothetical protein [Pseudomonas sp.]|nr:hypothetical protein [Pseudomonas sp.]MDU4249480.1 hypothetical protein [Pseudomonas sp.]